MLSNLTWLENSTFINFQDMANHRSIGITISTTLICLVIIGSIGNSFSFAVTGKMDLKELSIAVYLSVLSICDIILLVMSIPSDILSSDVMLGKDIVNMHPTLCSILTYISFWKPQLCS